MNKYLEKISEENTTKNKVGAASALGLGLVGNTIAGISVAPVQIPAVNHIKKTLYDKSNNSDLGTVRKMIQDNKLNVSFNTRKHNVEKQFSQKNSFHNSLKDAIRGAQMPAYVPYKGNSGKSFVVGVKKKPFEGKTKIVNTDVIMHELGHAKDFSKNRALKLGVSNAGRIGGLGAYGMLANEKTRKHATTLAAISALPTLRDEAAANYHAYKGIKAHRGAVAAGRYAKRLVPIQMATYLASAAAKVGGVHIAKKLIERAEKNDRK